MWDLSVLSIQCYRELTTAQKKKSIKLKKKKKKELPRVHLDKEREGRSS